MMPNLAVPASLTAGESPRVLDDETNCAEWGSIKNPKRASCQERKARSVLRSGLGPRAKKKYYGMASTLVPISTGTQYIPVPVAVSGLNFIYCPKVDTDILYKMWIRILIQF
jgi:hypothetical protein